MLHEWTAKLWPLENIGKFDTELRRILSEKAKEIRYFIMDFKGDKRDLPCDRFYEILGLSEEPERQYEAKFPTLAYAPKEPVMETKQKLAKCCCHGVPLAECPNGKPETKQEKWWRCPKCSAIQSTSFCPDDGTPRPVEKKICKECGRDL